METREDHLRVSAVSTAIAVFAAPLIAQRPTCGPMRQPKELPAVSTLVDSNAAITELRAAQALRDSMRFTLIFLAGDSMPFIHPLDSTEIRAATVLGRSVWPQRAGALWAIRVRVAGGPTPELTLERATYCPPELTTESRRPVVIGPTREERVATSLGVPKALAMPPPLHSVMDVVVSETGTVDSVKLVVPSGNANFDRDMMRVEWQDRFYPALIDGVPVPSVYRTSNRAPRP